MAGVRMNCESCGMSFNEDNLDECKICRRDVCYQCSVWVPKADGSGKKECRCNSCAAAAERAGR